MEVGGGLEGGFGGGEAVLEPVLWKCFVCARGFPGMFTSELVPADSVEDREIPSPAVETKVRKFPPEVDLK